MLVYSITIPSLFLTDITFRTLVSDQAITGILALAALIPLATGLIDLSFAAVAGFAAVLTTWLTTNTELGAVAIVLVAIFSSTLFGLASACFVTILKVNSLVATLGVSAVAATAGRPIACLGFDLVLADGTLRHIDVTAPSPTDADFAWALAGGGGSFGIVTIHDEPPGPTASLTTTVTLGELPDAALDAALAAIAPPGPPRALSLRRLGGALNRPGPAGPVRRDTHWLAGVIAIVPPGAPHEAAAAAEAHARHWRTAVAPWTDGRLANFLFGDAADPTAVEAAYPAATFRRLRDVKAAVDPDERLLAAAPIPAAEQLASGTSPARKPQL